MKKNKILKYVIFIMLLFSYDSMAWTLTLESPIGNDCRPQIFNVLQNPQIPLGVYVKYNTNTNNLLRWHRVLADAGNGYVIISGPNQNSDPRLDSWINIGQFNFLPNRRIKITVQIWEANNPQGTLQESSAWINIYSEQMQSTLPVVYENNKTVTLVASNIWRSFTQNACNRFITAGNYTIDIYKVEWNKSWNYGSIPNVNLDLSNSNGLPYNSNTFASWGAVDNITQNGARFTTHIFFIRKNSIGGDVNKWVPTHHNQAALTYTIQLNLPPIISELQQTPGTIGISGTGFMTCMLSQGTSVGYSWLSLYRPTFMTDNAPGNSTNKVQIWNNYSGSPGLFGPVYGLECRAANNHGFDVKSKGVIYSTNSGGCPFLYVQNEDTAFIRDNNILHRSEISLYSNLDITDLYKLNINPGIFEDKLNFMIIETEQDYNYIDQIKLSAIDHPQGTKIGVTENGHIVMYDTTQFKSSENASLNTLERITKYIYYGVQSDSTVNGDGGDNISLTSLQAPPNQTGDSLAFIILVGRDEDRIINPTPVKDFAGTISIYADGSVTSINIPFARREAKSEVIIPFASASSNVDSAIIYWDRDFQVDYVSVTPITYTGFTSTELLLCEANYPNDLDAYLKLIDIDQAYVEVDSLYQLSFSFSNIEPPGLGNIRDYVFKTTGRYEVPGAGDMHKNMSLEKPNNLPYKNKLFTNYPNPFNPVTKINYEISKSSFVKLIIYNVLGQEVRVLVNEIKNAGNYSVEFNGANLPSGLYIYRIAIHSDRLETEYFNDTKKMVLIK